MYSLLQIMCFTRVVSALVAMDIRRSKLTILIDFVRKWHKREVHGVLWR